MAETPHTESSELYGKHGQFVYHYTSREAAFEHILPSQRLRLSSLASMRDPVENKDWVQQLVTFGDAVDSEDDAVSGAEAEAMKTAQKAARSTVFNTKLLSFTLDADEPAGGAGAEHARGCARPRMWEQYAENHMGVCLVFDQEELNTALMKIFSIFNDAFSGKVGYSNQPWLGSEEARILDVGELQRRGDGDIPAGLRAHIKDHLGELFFRKLEDWSTEQELRYLLLDEDPYEISAQFEGSLRAVILGEKFPTWQLPGASVLCENFAVDLRQIEWGPFPPRVFDPVEDPR